MDPVEVGPHRARAYGRDRHACALDFFVHGLGEQQDVCLGRAVASAIGERLKAAYRGDVDHRSAAVLDHDWQIAAHQVDDRLHVHPDLQQLEVAVGLDERDVDPYAGVVDKNLDSPELFNAGGESCAF